MTVISIFFFNRVGALASTPNFRFPRELKSSLRMIVIYVNADDSVDEEKTSNPSSVLYYALYRLGSAGRVYLEPPCSWYAVGERIDVSPDTQHYRIPVKSIAGV